MTTPADNQQAFSVESNFEYLRSKRVYAELRTIQRGANNVTAFKTFLAVTVLAASIALLVLFGTASAFLGTGIGLILLSGYALTYYKHQYQENNSLFKKAASALNG
jgi:hypothetical protein